MIMQVAIDDLDSYPNKASLRTCLDNLRRRSHDKSLFIITISGEENPLGHELGHVQVSAHANGSVCFP